MVIGRLLASSALPLKLLPAARWTLASSQA
jgi:hypothetical protein